MKRNKNHRSSSYSDVEGNTKDEKGACAVHHQSSGRRGTLLLFMHCATHAKDTVGKCGEKGNHPTGHTLYIVGVLGWTLQK